MRAIFYILFLFLRIYPKFIYHNIIQMTINADPRQIKKDLAIVDEYKKKQMYELYGEENIAAPLTDAFYYHDLTELHNRMHHFDLYREIAKKLLEISHSGISDVCVYYRGFYKYSDQSGRVVFPRLDLLDNVPIVIAMGVEPIILNGAIPDHFIVNADLPYAIYQTSVFYFMDKQNNEKMGWKVLPSYEGLVRGEIPYNAIILFGDPANFLFSEQEMVGQKSLNIILPPLYLYYNEQDIFGHYGQLAINTLRYWQPIKTTSGETQFDNQLHNAYILK